MDKAVVSAFQSFNKIVHVCVCVCVCVCGKTQQRGEGAEGGHAFLCDHPRYLQSHRLASGHRSFTVTDDQPV